MHERGGGEDFEHAHALADVADSHRTTRHRVPKPLRGVRAGEFFREGAGFSFDPVPRPPLPHRQGGEFAVQLSLLLRRKSGIGHTAQERLHMPDAQEPAGVGLVQLRKPLRGLPNVQEHRGPVWGESEQQRDLPGQFLARALQILVRHVRFDLLEHPRQQGRVGGTRPLRQRIQQREPVPVPREHRRDRLRPPQGRILFRTCGRAVQQRRQPRTQQPRQPPGGFGQRLSRRRRPRPRGVDRAPRTTRPLRCRHNRSPRTPTRIQHSESHRTDASPDRFLSCHPSGSLCFPDAPEKMPPAYPERYDTTSPREDFLLSIP